MNSLSSIESQYSNCGIIILGDFNQLNIAGLKRSYGLQQIVQFPTRGNNRLDLVLTNLKQFYQEPIKRPPFGLSDHMSIEVKPKERSQLPVSKCKVKSRDLRPSNRLAVRSYLKLVDVPSILKNAVSCEGKVSMFEEIVKTGLDNIIPLRSKTIQLNEPPWMTLKLKGLIRNRQIALSEGNDEVFRHLRNCVNRERKACRSKYYTAKVQHLKKCKPSVWWKEVKKLTGMTSSSGVCDDITKSLQHLDEFSTASTKDLANIINEAFLTPMRGFSPLHQSGHFPGENAALVVTVDSVYKKLSSLNSTKAQGPDGIPTWLLKENADLLANPVKDILNCSYREGCLPKSWKEADIIPVPKQKPILDINKPLRPISLTPVLSKLGEEFVVNEFVKPAVLKRIDVNQFGTVPKSSTTQALISMLHNWNKNTDGTGSTVRIVLFDFRKAFDLIDHTILVRKLLCYELPSGIVGWIVDFLTDRKQRVKLSNDCFSEWGTIPAGVPQGTKLGPWLFLIMINELNIEGVNLWKYVDDTTIAETVSRQDTSSMQEYVNELTSQSLVDNFQLNEAKCKELRISFTRGNLAFDPIVINNKQIDTVSSVKLLGLNISNDLKWNTHISEIVHKVSSRLYFLRQLKRACPTIDDLLSFYLTCVRPITEYACPVFHNALPKYLSEDLEKLQKRALRIIYPNMKYSDALKTAGLASLHERRESLTTGLFQQIMENENHKLHALLPNRNSSSVSLRRKRVFNIPPYKTLRFKNSFLMSIIL